MSKAILVIDMPSSCLDCPCSKFNPNIKTECCWECEAGAGELAEINLDIERPMLCPLRECPQKKEPSQPPLSPLLKTQYTEYERGYNACIDEILGGIDDD